MNKKETVRSTDSGNYVTVTLTHEKMETAGVMADISHNGDLHLSLPELSIEQKGQLNELWESFRHHLQDIGTDPAVTHATLEAAMDTHWKETNARVILSLI